MDRIIYTAMNGAARITEHQAALSNNMANVNTPGFREQIALYRSVPVNDGVSLPTRVSTVASTPRNNFEMGNMQTTGRDLDVALASSNGWIAVQTPQGEAYTRAGSLQVGVNGLLQTSLGQPVMSDQNGIIDVPDQAALTITSDGTITAIGAGDAPNNILNLGRIKLVNPPRRSWCTATTASSAWRRSTASPRRRCRRIPACGCCRACWKAAIPIPWRRWWA